MKAARDADVDVINMSFGSYSYDSSLSDAIDLTWEKGIVMVGAAGNDRKSEAFTGQPQYPAGFIPVIAVSATNKDNTWEEKSNWGDWVDVAAPGENILSTRPHTLFGIPHPSGGYGYDTGTSMAAPHVSGLAGLLASQGLTASEIRDTIETTTVDLPLDAPNGRDPNFGFGLINAADAVNTIVTNINDSGPGSLRKAIAYANANNDPDTINISATGTVGLQTALPSLSTDMKIVGPGADKFTVRRSGALGTPDFRIFTVDRESKVTISGLTATNGVANSCNSMSSHSCGGGIYSEGDLTVKDSVISENTAVAHGGGIENYGGRLTVKGSTIANNMVEGTANSSGLGGGIINLAGAYTITDSIISGNTAGWGGGLSSWRDFNGSKNAINNTTVSGNIAKDRGGGVLLNAAFGESHTTIKYSIITNNTAPRGEGSGVYGSKDASSTKYTKVFSSIIADNTNSDVDNGFISKGYNLIGDGNATRAFRARGDRVGITNPGRVIRGTQRNNKLDGTSGSDIIHGFRGSDTIRGLGGTDIILGGSGNDIIYSGAGNDTTYGGSGNNTIRGGGGNDRLVGEAGKDRLFGQGGKDNLSGGGGPDPLIGGPGVDRLYGHGGNDFLNVKDKKPKDVANGGAGRDRCVADRGDKPVSCEE